MTRRIAIFLTCTLVAATAHAQSSGQEKPVLEMTKANWIALRDFNGQQLVYFTHLESWRCGIAQVRYSVNSDALDHVWQLQPCDQQNPNAVTTDKPYIAFPGGSVQSVAVQLTYRDGTTSQVAHFKQ